MRVLFVPWGQTTHWFHMVPLAWAFRAAGHEVRIVAQPGVVAAVAASGLTATHVDRDYDLVATRTREADQGIRQDLAELRRRYPRRDRSPASLAQLRELTSRELESDRPGAGAAGGIAAP